jgi:hypothetical protein
MPTFFQLTTFFVSTTTVLSLAGCALPGQREMSGACPAGETCSSATPSGLFFSGASLSDGILGTSGVTPVAVGGRETVTASEQGTSQLPPFTVTASGNEFFVTDAISPSFVLRAEAPGTSLVQLFQSGTSELLDQVDLEAEVISSVTLFPQDLVLLLAEGNAMTSSGGTPQPVPFALLAGTTSKLPLVVRLHGTGTDRLVDEGITVTSTQAVGLSQTKWDLIEISVPTSAPQVTFSVQTGSSSFVVSAPVVDAVDSIVPIGKLPQVGTAGSTDLCFTAQSGGALVAGVTWTFSSSSNVTVGTDTIGAGCVQVKGQSAGTATLTATASGFAQTFNFTVVAGTPKGARIAPRHDALRGVVQPVAGHRAEQLAAR